MALPACLLAGSAAAQPPAADVLERAKALYAAGQAAMKAGDFEAAVEAFEQSRALAPSWLNLVGAGAAWLELGRCGRARARFAEAAEVEPPAPEAEVVEGIRLSTACAAPARFETRPPGATVSVDGEPAGRTPLTVHVDVDRPLEIRLHHPTHREAVLTLIARRGETPVVRRTLVPKPGRIVAALSGPGALYVDGARAGAGPGRIELEVAPGAHRVRFERPGCAPEVRRVRVEAAEATEPLAPAPCASPDATAPAEPDDIGPLPWMVVGMAAAAGVTVGAVYGARAVSTAGEVDCDAPTAPAATRERCAEARTDATIAWVGFGVAAAAAASAGLLWHLDSDGEVAVAPAPGGASFAVRW